MLQLLTRYKKSFFELLNNHADFLFSGKPQQTTHGFLYKGQEYTHFSLLPFHETAYYRLSLLQLGAILYFLLVCVTLFLLNWRMALVEIIAILTFLYFMDLLFNFYLICRSFSRPPEISLSEHEIASHTQWPAYTILCPLYKEGDILPQFITSIESIDYPKNKLQVLLLLEEDDLETITKVRTISLPPCFSVVIIPDTKPKTKPKAMNYGLSYVTGEYIAVYDAEDIPDPLQLKKVFLAFQKVASDVVCIQAKLNFYNSHQNLLTRAFTAEYSLWFELVLTGLQSINAPIPLGGTSNHFRKRDLLLLKGWDAFNVTEDCDLGIRLAKKGYKTAMVDSTTLEEANSSPGNWFPQRVRWVKGYMQTYLVHMRHPEQMMQDWKKPHVITFQLVVGGKVLSMLINPVMWIITLGYALFRPTIGAFIDSLFPAPVLYMGVISFIFGNFLYVLYYMIGCVKKGHDDIVKYVFLVPFYWIAMSAAAYCACYELITNPHYWSKTTHGLHLQSEKGLSESEQVVGRRVTS